MVLLTSGGLERTPTQPQVGNGGQEAPGPGDRRGGEESARGHDRQAHVPDAAGFGPGRGRYMNL